MEDCRLRVLRGLYAKGEWERAWAGLMGGEMIWWVCDAALDVVCARDMERSEVGVVASSSTAEVEGWVLDVWSCCIWDCCWRIMLRRRFYAIVSLVDCKTSSWVVR